MRLNHNAITESAQAAYRRRKSVAGWKGGCVRRDRTWERDNRIDRLYREGVAVDDIVAAPWCDIGRRAAYYVIARIRAARAEKAMLAEPERHRRRCARGAWLRTERLHRRRLRRRLETGAPYDPPAFPADLRRRYPRRLAMRFDAVCNEQNSCAESHARRPPGAGCSAGEAGGEAAPSVDPRAVATAALVAGWRRRALMTWRSPPEAMAG